MMTMKRMVQLGNMLIIIPRELALLAQSQRRSKIIQRYLNKAENILIKTIAEYKEHMLNDSKFSHCYILTDFVILYIGPEVNYDMAVLMGLWRFLLFALPDSSL